MWRAQAFVHNLASFIRIFVTFWTHFTWQGISRTLVASICGEQSSENASLLGGRVPITSSAATGLHVTRSTCCFRAGLNTTLLPVVSFLTGQKNLLFIGTSTARCTPTLPRLFKPFVLHLVPNILIGFLRIVSQSAAEYFVVRKLKMNRK